MLCMYLNLRHRVLEDIIHKKYTSKRESRKSVSVLACGGQCVVEWVECVCLCLCVAVEHCAVCGPRR